MQKRQQFDYMKWLNDPSKVMKWMDRFHDLAIKRDESRVIVALNGCHNAGMIWKR